jgi:hypothetical protein
VKEKHVRHDLGTKSLWSGVEKGRDAPGGDKLSEIGCDGGPNSKHGGAEGGRQESDADTEFIGERDPEETSHAVGNERTVDGVSQLLKGNLVIRGKVKEARALVSDETCRVTYHNNEIGCSEPSPVCEDRKDNVLLKPWEV